jgi:hypothetical protein
MKHIIKNIVVLFCLLCTFSLNTFACNYSCDNNESYVKKRGSCATLTNQLRRARQLFEKVCLVSNNKKVLPQFEILNTKSTRHRFLAVARYPNKITLSKYVVDVCYRGVETEPGDACLAFILGHELAHLANGDVLPKGFLMKGNSTSQNQLRWEQEEKADDQGFIYAAIAGYPVNNLLGQQDFFVDWVKKTDATRGITDTHPNIKKRAAILRNRLQKIADELAFFQFGVRLSHFNRCEEEGLYFLERFEKTFPAREVLNNKGYCYLQQAVTALESDAYWLTSVLDVATRAEELTAPPVLRGKISNQAKQFLTKAQVVFAQAQPVAPSYVPTYINLATTWLYLGKIDKARQAITEIPNNKLPMSHQLEIQGLKAIIQYEEGRIPQKAFLQNQAISQLHHLAQQNDAPLTVLYNTAQLLEKNRHRGADKIWQRLAVKAVNLPPSIRHIVCQKQNCSSRQRLQPRLTWGLPVEVGIYITHDAKTWNTLQQWERQKKPLQFKQHNFEGQIHQSHTAEVLELNGSVAMVVLKKPQNVTPSNLDDYCGQSLYKNTVINGTLWRCDNWVALVVDNRVKEIWVVEKE